MHFDRLDDIYAMVESNWQFDNFIQTSLTDLYVRPDRFAQIVQQI